MSAELTLYDKIPDACPACSYREDNGPWYTKCEHFNKYDDCDVESQVEYYDEYAEPDEQPARIYCSDCYVHLRMSASLVEEVFCG